MTQNGPVVVLRGPDLPARTIDQSSPTRRQAKPEKPSEKASRFLMGMDRVGQALVAHKPLDELLGIVVDRVREVLHVERAALFLVDRESGELVPHATAQEPSLEVGDDYFDYFLGGDGTMWIAPGDGVTEGRNGDDGEFGEEKLANFLAENRALSPHEFAEKPIDTVIDFRLDGDPGDDVTALLVRSD